MRRLGFALTMALALGLFVAAPALAAPTQQQDCYPSGNPTASVSTTSPTPGQTVTVTGGNFKPESHVSVLFDGDQIAHGQTDAQGGFSIQVTIPSDASIGDHTITLSGVGGDCVSPATVEIPVTLVSGAEGGAGGGGGGAGGAGGVAFTGANISLGMLLIAAMVIVGAAALIVGRRRKVGVTK